MTRSYRNDQEVAVIKDSPEERAQLQARLANPDELLGEVNRFLTASMQEWKYVYVTQVAREISAFIPEFELSIRSQVNRILELYEQEGVLTWSSQDHNEDTKRRELSPLGFTVLKDGTAEFLIFGFPRIFEKKRDAVCALVVGENEGNGTAFHLGNGEYVTCAHCCPPNAHIHLHPGAGAASFPATVAKRCNTLDIAILKAQPIATELKIHCDGLAKVLDRIVLLHCPPVSCADTTVLATTGEINGITYDHHRKAHDFIISATAAPGSSGAPVLDRRGRVVGMVFGSGQTVGTTDPIDSVGPFFHAVPAPQICEKMQT